MVQIDSPSMLQYIDMLLKHGNYTKAAKDLYISQPYLTQTIQKVEEELDIKIINRKVSPLQLTEAGKIYYQYLNSLETEQDQFRKKIAKYSSPNFTIIRIGVLPSLGTYLLPLFLPAYMKSHPNVKIELYEATPAQNEERILNGELDLFIGQNSETISPNLTVHSCGKHSYYAIIPKSSPLFQKDQILLKPNTLSLKELLMEKLVLTTRGSAIRRQVDYLLQKYKVQPDIILESDNVFTVVEFAKKDLGVTFVPESVYVSSTEGPYNIYPLPMELLSLGYFIAHPANKTLIPAETELIASFIQQLEATLLI